MEGGWIRLHRQLENHWIAENNDYFHWWVDMLWMAAFQDIERDGVKIKRGQFEASVSFLTKRWSINRKTLDRKTVINFLKRLENEQMITRIVTDGKKAIITICNYDKYQYTQRLQADTSLDEIMDTLTDIKTDTIKELINKLNKKIKPPKPPKGGRDKPAKEPFVVDPAFAEAFDLWLQYKHEKRQSYKGESSLKACYNKLVKLSHGDPQIAMAIVEQSMANNWAGLFGLKQDYNGTTATNRGGFIDSRQAERQHLAAGVAATIARLAAEDDARQGAVREQSGVPY